MKSRAMAIPYVFAGVFMLIILVRGLYINFDTLKFNFGTIVAAIIFGFIIVSVFTDAYKKLRGK